jgi:hypothetical protein
VQPVDKIVKIKMANMNILVFIALFVYVAGYFVQLPGWAAFHVNSIPFAATRIVCVALYRYGNIIAVSVNKANVGDAAFVGVVNSKNIAR